MRVAGLDGVDSRHGPQRAKLSASVSRLMTEDASAPPPTCMKMRSGWALAGASWLTSS